MLQKTGHFVRVSLWLLILLTASGYFLPAVQNAIPAATAGIRQELPIPPQDLRVRVLGENDRGVRAEVRLRTPGSPESTTSTDLSGIANFHALKPGNYTIIVSVDGRDLFYRNHFLLTTSQGFKSAVVRLHIHAPAVRAETVSLNELRAPQKARQIYFSAVEAIHAQKFENASDLLHNAIAIYPTYARAYNALGVLCGLTGRPEESEAAFRTAIRYDSGFPEPHFNLGKLLLESKKPVEARDELQRVFDLNSEHLPAIELLLNTMLKTSDEDSAVSLLRTLHLKDSNHGADLHFELASVLEGRGKTGLAAEQYSLVLKHKLSVSDRQAAEAGLRRTETATQLIH